MESYARRGLVWQLEKPRKKSPRMVESETGYNRSIFSELRNVYTSVPNCPSSNSFVLITMQIAGGGGIPGRCGSESIT